MHWLLAKLLAEKFKNRNLAFLANTGVGDMLAYELAKISKGFIIDSMTFKYRRKITITEQSGNNLSDYQVRIDLDATNFDFSHFLNEGKDLRFTDASGNLLPYWVEKMDIAAEEATIWVKVPAIPANSSASIYMYYGNSTVDSASNGWNVFLGFHDFERLITGAWCWFQDPRAVRYVGVHDRTYIGFADRSGNIAIIAYDHTTKRELSAAILHPALETDDHAAPAILISEGYILVFYSAHNGANLYMRKSVKPEDISEWEDEKVIATGSITYPNPVKTSTGRIYVFYRQGNSNDGDLYYIYSDDEGNSWSSPTQLVDWGSDCSYFKIAAKNNEIHVAITTAEGGETNPHYNIYYFYSDDGGITWKKRDGSVLTLPITPSTAELVYETPANSNSWVWDIAIDDEGNPWIVFADELETDNHKYKCARWTGSEWQITLIANSNYGGLYSIEGFYSGGVYLNHDDPSIVYCAIYTNGNFEIQKFKFNGETWSKIEDITSGGNKWNIRPVHVRSAHPELEVVWMWGDYPNFYEYKTIIHTQVLRPQWQGGIDCAGEEKNLMPVGADSYAGKWAADATSSYPRMLMLDFGCEISSAAVEVWFYDDVNDTNRQVLSLQNCPTDVDYLMLGAHIDYSATNYIYRVGGNRYTTSISRSTGWHKLRIKCHNGITKFEIDCEEVGTTGDLASFRQVMIGSYWSEPGEGKYDNIIVRKYTEPEPSVSIGEETA